MKSLRRLSRALVLSVLLLMAALLTLALFNPWHPANQVAVAFVLFVLLFYPMKTIFQGFIGHPPDESGEQASRRTGPEKPDEDETLDKNA